MSAISVIVPVYEVENCLSRCIDSVRSQKYQDFELILVDDGSSDGCGFLCDSSIGTDNRIIVVHQKNNGVSTARNNGVKTSNGEFIAFLDSDDWLSPLYLEALFSSACSAEADISVCGINKVKELINEEEKLDDSHSINKVFSGRDALIYYGSMMDMRIRGPVAKLVRKSIVQKFLFPVGRKYGEDLACAYRWIYEAKKVVDIKEKYYYYYQRDESVSHTNGKHTLDTYLSYDEMLLFLKKHNLYKPFYVVLQKYLYDVSSFYEELFAANDKELLGEVSVYFNAMLTKYLNYQGDSEKDLEKFKYRENILKLSSLKEFGIYDMHLNSCLWGLCASYRSVTDIKEKKKIKSRLKKLVLSSHPPISDYLLIYEIAFPKLTQLYYHISSVKNKLKG